MKSLFLTLLALALCASAHAASTPLTTSVFRAITQENACMVSYVYATVGSTDASDSAQQDAVVHCVDFTQGTGAWYVRNHEARHEPVALDSDAAQGALRAFRNVAGAYLRKALARCSAAHADEQACLALLKLTPKP